MGRYRKVENFMELPLRKRQEWVNEFVQQAEWNMSDLRRRQYHGIVVRYVWTKLNKGRAYVSNGFSSLTTDLALLLDQHLEDRIDAVLVELDGELGPVFVG